MLQNKSKDISCFFVAGINYRKSDAAIRGQFAIDDRKYGAILFKAGSMGLDELFVLSTCNRTEIYGFAPDPQVLIELLCSETSGNANIFRLSAYIKTGDKAINHLFNVSAGLDSQILGDYEVVSQVKQAARFSREHGFMGSFTERMVSSVLQVSKIIKNQTQLSSGTVSVAYAAVQMLRRMPNLAEKQILLVGIGKIGRNTCRNLIDYLEIKQITLINRTDTRAREFALKYGLKAASYRQLKKKIEESDVIIVATNAPAPTIKARWLEKSGPKLILDLSVPSNVEEGVKNLPNIKLIGIDELSRIQDETLQKRQAEIPRAQAIIEENMQEFLYWNQMRRHAVVLQGVKKKLQEIHAREISTQKTCNPAEISNFQDISSRIIQKTINLLATKVRREHPKNDQFIEMISELFETTPKN
ncbi:MAG TPA: glutamyl-tRNA reductase [Chitinophagaceae bacterium]|nr:glutamyl-tRNA reductase [Chitinophagaceae bacterium]